MTFWPQWPQMTPGDFSIPITFVEGVKLYHMFKPRVNAT